MQKHFRVYWLKNKISKVDIQETEMSSITNPKKQQKKQEEMSKEGREREQRRQEIDLIFDQMSQEMSTLVCCLWVSSDESKENPTVAPTAETRIRIVLSAASMLKKSYEHRRKFDILGDKNNYRRHLNCIQGYLDSPVTWIRGYSFWYGMENHDEEGNVIG